MLRYKVLFPLLCDLFECFKVMINLWRIIACFCFNEVAYTTVTQIIVPLDWSFMSAVSYSCLWSDWLPWGYHMTSNWIWSLEIMSNVNWFFFSKKYVYDRKSSAFVKRVLFNLMAIFSFLKCILIESFSWSYQMISWTSFDIILCNNMPID